jgi:hypothetical protein
LTVNVWPSRRASVLIAVTVTVVAASTLLIGFFRGPERDDYLRKNERVVRALPLPDGAHETTRQILRNEKTVFGEQLSHTVGYTTYVTYAAPEALTSLRVVRFYGRRLTGWHGTRWRVDGTWFACFVRRGAAVSIQPEGLDPIGRTHPKTYGVAVTSEGGRCD